MRLVGVAASAAMTLAGTVTAVFTDDAERQGAYGFLESKRVGPNARERGVGETLARRCATEEARGPRSWRGAKDRPRPRSVVQSFDSA